METWNIKRKVENGLHYLWKMINEFYSTKKSYTLQHIRFTFFSSFTLRYPLKKQQLNAYK